MLALSAINLVGAIAVLASAFAPATMHHFFRAGVACGVLLAAFALGIFGAGDRVGRGGLFAGALVQVGLVSAIVAEAPTHEGSTLATLAYVWSAIYAASFFTRTELYLVLTATAAGSAGALAAQGISRWVGYWVVLVVTITTTAVVLERSVDHLRREADTDALTGLLNRRGFFKAATIARSISARAGLLVALVVIDLDNFKAVNDVEGHAGGDRLLIEATGAWRAQLRAGDLLARFGGDEFVILVPGLSAPELDSLIDRCHGAHPIAWTGGVAFLLENEPIEVALERADRLLYEAKLRSRGFESTS